MVYSSSYMYAKEVFGSSGHFFLKQIIFVLTGAAIAYTLTCTKFGFWIKYSFHFNIACSMLLILTFVPHIGITVKGASRWIGIGGFGFQPGELIKFTLILSSYYLFENFKDLSIQDKVKYSFTLLFPLGLLVAQPDYGSFIICLVVIGFVCFLSSFPRKHFYTFFASGVLLGFTVLFAEPYRIKRIFTFLDPWKNPKTSGFQIIQSYLAFANGSIWGTGLGNSNEKLFYLPEAHNDFIFSVIGEELGFIGVITVVLTFIAFIYLGLKLAMYAKEKVAVVLIAAVIFTIALQTFLNMGVVLGLLPTKGLNLPFISYGGSSLISNFFGIGLLFSALRYESR